MAPSNIVAALRGMQCLTHLVLHSKLLVLHCSCIQVLPTFLTNNIVRALATTCAPHLLALQADHSNRLTDAAVPDLVRLNNIRLLGNFVTKGFLGSLTSLKLAAWMCIIRILGKELCTLEQ